MGVISLQIPQRQVRLGRESEIRDWNTGLEMGHDFMDALKSWAIGFCPLHPPPPSLGQQPGRVGAARLVRRAKVAVYPLPHSHAPAKDYGNPLNLFGPMCREE